MHRHLVRAPFREHAAQTVFVNVGSAEDFGQPGDAGTRNGRLTNHIEVVGRQPWRDANLPSVPAGFEDPQGRRLIAAERDAGVLSKIRRRLRRAVLPAVAGGGHEDPLCFAEVSRDQARVPEFTGTDWFRSVPLCPAAWEFQLLGAHSAK